MSRGRTPVTVGRLRVECERSSYQQHLTPKGDPLRFPVSPEKLGASQYNVADSCRRRALGLGGGGTARDAQHTNGLEDFFVGRGRLYARVPAHPHAQQHARFFT